MYVCLCLKTNEYIDTYIYVYIHVYMYAIVLSGTRALFQELAGRAVISFGASSAPQGLASGVAEFPEMRRSTILRRILYVHMSMYYEYRCMHVNLCIYRSIYLYMYVCIYTHTSISISICLSIYVSICIAFIQGIRKCITYIYIYTHISFRHKWGHE